MTIRIYGNNPTRPWEIGCVFHRFTIGNLPMYISGVTDMFWFGTEIDERTKRLESRLSELETVIEIRATYPTLACNSPGRSPLNPPLKLYQTEQVTATTHAPLAPRCKHANQAGTSRAWNPHRLRSLPPDQPYQTICATHS